MSINYWTRNRCQPAFGEFLHALISLFDPKFDNFQPLALEMETQTSVPTKRPFCSSCSKPARLCICSRFKSPLLDNSISVTILQHIQEKSHPLNSTRIATLGLKNLTVATVSDIHFDTQFQVRLLKPGSLTRTDSAAAMEVKNGENAIGRNLRTGCVGSDTHLENSQKNEKKSDFEQTQECTTKKKMHEIDSNGTYCDLISEVDKRDTILGSYMAEEEDITNFLAVRDQQNHIPKPDFDPVRANLDEEECVISGTMTKCGSTFSLTHLRCPKNHYGKTDFEQFLDTQIGKHAISNGFVVKKLQKKKLGESEEFRECEEFEIAIPPGSALLFPTKKAIGIEAVDFKVNNLIVLDGTWNKAKRMYHENPWLKLLPQLKLDPDKISLYGEVRHQPKAGCLSTIESIVFALKAFGDESEGLEDILDVFKSMIGDQRRCKDEKFSNMCSK